MLSFRDPCAQDSASLGSACVTVAQGKDLGTKQIQMKLGGRSDCQTLFANEHALHSLDNIHHVITSQSFVATIDQANSEPRPERKVETRF